MRKKILISAYAISPTKGAEYGAAWNTVINLAKEHELWVLYGMSDDHMGDTQTLKSYIEANPLPSVTFIEVKAPLLAKNINLLNKMGLGWFFYFAYYLWQKEALNTARVLLETVDIDIAHQLGPIGFRKPGFLGELDKPLIWGPVGGMNIVNPVLLKGKSFSTRIKFRVNNIVNKIQLNYSPRIAGAFKRADVVLSATTNGKHTIQDKFGKQSYLMQEQGIIGDIDVDEEKFNNIHQRVELIWLGSHIERKNLQLCLDALSLVKQNNWVLHILGDGPLTKQLKKKAKDLDLSGIVIWHGHLPRAEAVQLMQLSHLHIITSIAEDNPAVIFEAMSAGVPTLTLNHCGMRDMLSEKCAIKIKVDSHHRMAENIAERLDYLLDNPEVLADMALVTLNCAAKYAWGKRLKLLNSCYDAAIEVYKNKIAAKAVFSPLIILEEAQHEHAC
jgi:glycosyltransferase involved in cell wall biosynthesis